MSSRSERKTVVVTGGASGIGAGTGRRFAAEGATELGLDDWHAQLGVNLPGLYLAARTFTANLTQQHGSLIATSSVQALFGLPGHPAYAASKGAIGALVRQLAVEYGPGVRVNAVLPGPILTSMWDGR